MIIGISIGLETCLILGQVSLTLLHLKRDLQTDICGPGRDSSEFFVRFQDGTFH